MCLLFIQHMQSSRIISTCPSEHNEKEVMEVVYTAVKKKPCEPSNWGKPCNMKPLTQVKTPVYSEIYNGEAISTVICLKNLVDRPSGPVDFLRSNNNWWDLVKKNGSIPTGESG